MIEFGKVVSIKCMGNRLGIIIGFDPVIGLYSVMVKVPYTNSEGFSNKQYFYSETKLEEIPFSEFKFSEDES